MHILHTKKSWYLKANVGTRQASYTQQLRNYDFYKPLLLLFNDDSLTEKDLCYFIIWIYYLIWTSKFNREQQRSDWSFHTGWSMWILKTKANIFYNRGWPPWFNKRQHQVICKSIQDVQLSHSSRVFLLLNPHCQCLFPSSICLKGNITVLGFPKCTGLSQANSISLPLSSDKQPTPGRGEPTTLRLTPHY